MNNDDVRAGRAHVEARARRLLGKTSPADSAADAGTPRMKVLQGETADGDGEAEVETINLPLARCALTAPQPAPTEFLIDKLIPQADIGVVAGAGGDGKSTLVLNIAGSVAAGERFLGKFDVRQGPVFYVSEEDTEATILNRLKAMIAARKWDRDRVLGNFHYLALEGVSLDSTQWQYHLISEARRIGAVLVVLDPYFDLTRAPESDNSAQKVIIHFLRRFAQETGATILVVHHVAKPSEGRAKVDRLRGASAIRDAARFIYWVEAAGESGISVECLKLTRAAKHPRFVVSREIRTAAGHDSVWESVRFEFVNAAVAEVVSAERFVLDQLARADRLNTTELKDQAKGTGISGADVSQALKALRLRGTIDFELGPKNSRLWNLVAGQPRQPANGPLACLPGLAGQPAETPSVLALPPIGGRQASTAVGAVGGGMEDL